MNSEELRFFKAVALTSSIGGAARLLNSSQSNVTTRIKKLEARLGLSLFRRHARGVEMTPAGQRLLPYAQQCEILLAEACRHVTDVGHANGPLRLGAMETTTATRLGTMLADFTRAFPDVDLSLVTGTSQELMEQVLNRDLDAAFVCGPLKHSKLTSRRCFTEELALLKPPESGPVDTIAKSRRRALVLKKGCAYRGRLEQVLGRRGLNDFKIVEFGTVDAILATVAAGLGVTLMPKSLLPHYSSRYKWAFDALLDEERFVETVMISPSQSTYSTALTEFLKLAVYTESPEPKVVALGR